MIPAIRSEPRTGENGMSPELAEAERKWRELCAIVEATGTRWARKPLQQRVADECDRLVSVGVPPKSRVLREAFPAENPLTLAGYLHLWKRGPRLRRRMQQSP